MMLAEMRVICPATLLYPLQQLKLLSMTWFSFRFILDKEQPPSLISEAHAEGKNVAEGATPY